MAFLVVSRAINTFLGALLAGHFAYSRCGLILRHSSQNYTHTKATVGGNRLLNGTVEVSGAYFTNLQWNRSVKTALIDMIKLLHQHWRFYDGQSV